MLYETITRDKKEIENYNNSYSYASKPEDFLSTNVFDSYSSTPDSRNRWLDDYGWI